MKALSIRQPWAWLIVNGYKDIENRTWVSDFRGRIYVHAGKRVQSGDFPEQRDYIIESGLMVPEEPPLGAIVGEVTVTDCVGTSSSPWFCGPYGFLLSSPVAYKDPIPYRGQLGFFQVEENKLVGHRSIKDKIRDAITEMMESQAARISVTGLPILVSELAEKLDVVLDSRMFGGNCEVCRRITGEDVL